jgi:hypothetical protein
LDNDCDGVLDEPACLNPNQGVPTWDADIQPIINNYCGVCHGASGGWSSLEYSSTQKDSYHCLGMAKGECFSVRIKEESMPANGSVLSAMMMSGELDLIDAWIDAGMPENNGATEPTTCVLYCDTQAIHCIGENAIEFAVDCLTDCATWPEGEEGDASGNSAHCRLYHAGVAGYPGDLTPVVHCAHATPDGAWVCTDPCTVTGDCVPGWECVDVDASDQDYCMLAEGCSCDDKSCGDENGCGGICGGPSFNDSCAAGFCSESGQCMAECADGQVATCDEDLVIACAPPHAIIAKCTGAQDCVEGACQVAGGDCDCAGKACGEPDGCGGICTGEDSLWSCVGDVPGDCEVPVCTLDGTCETTIFELGSPCTTEFPDGDSLSADCMVPEGACFEDLCVWPPLPNNSECTPEPPEGADSLCVEELGFCDSGGCKTVPKTDGTECGDACGSGTCVDGECNDYEPITCEPGWTCQPDKLSLNGSPCWPNGEPAITGLTSGAYHTCARVAKILTPQEEPILDQDAICWGHPAGGRLGHGGEKAPEGTPVLADVLWLDGDGWLSAGGDHTCLVSGETIECWGMIVMNGVSPPQYNAVTLELGPPEPSADFASGDGFSCQLRPDNAFLQQYGQIRCWGENDKAQLGNGATDPTGEPTWVTDAGYGDVDPSEAEYVGGVALDAWGSSACVVRKPGDDNGGTVSCWGSGAAQEALGLADPVDRATELQDSSAVTDVAVGEAHVCALYNDGKAIVCWGDNSVGQLGTPLGTLGSISPITPTNAPGFSSDTVKTQIDAGAHHTCIVQDGQAACWGDNSHGQILGIATEEPMLMAFAFDAVEVSAGATHTCARLVTGEVRCWGGLETLPEGVTRAQLLGAMTSDEGEPSFPLNLCHLAEGTDEYICGVPDEPCINEVSCYADAGACAVNSVGTIWCDVESPDPCIENTQCVAGMQCGGGDDVCAD